MIKSRPVAGSVIKEAQADRCTFRSRHASTRVRGQSRGKEFDKWRKHAHMKSRLCSALTWTKPRSPRIWTRSRAGLPRAAARCSNTNVWGRRQLAYAIGKQTNGVYVQFDFQLELPAPAVRSLTESMRGIDENIIRHLVVRLDEK